MAAPSDESTLFVHRGWSFSHVSQSHIASSRELGALADALSLGTVPLPEMTFAHNFLEVRHAASGLRIRFDAEGALHNWHERQCASAAVVSGVRVPVSVENYDFTFTTAFEGATLGARADAFASTAETLPLDRLRERAPLLAYARVPLFASDLNDRGTVEALVKLRVMDDAFLVLFRAYTRLDRDRVRLHDVRFFHAFGERALLKDVQLRVALVADVIAAEAAGGAAGGDGLPTGPPSFFTSPPAAPLADAVSPPPPLPSDSSLGIPPDSPPPRTVHPVVLASMRERAAKQGLAVRDDEELINLLCATAPAPCEFSAVFASPPPTAARSVAQSGPRSPLVGTALWSARPGAFVLSPAAALLVEPRADDAAPLKLDVSAEQVWAVVDPVSHAVYSLALEA
jgi:hypothetical protein